MFLGGAGSLSALPASQPPLAPDGIIGTSGALRSPSSKIKNFSV